MSLATVPWEADEKAGDERSITRATTIDDAQCGLLSVDPALNSNRINLTAGVWEMVLVTSAADAKDTFAIFTKIGQATVTVPAAGASGTITAHSWIGRGDEKWRFRIRAGVNTYVAVQTTASAVHNAVFRRISE